MPVLAGDVVRLTVMCEMGGEDVQNVFYVKNYGSTGVDNSTFLADAVTWLDDCYDNIDALQGNNLEYSTIQAYNMTSGVPIGEDTWDTMTVGGNSTDQEYAKQIAALVRFTTNVARSQGRKFLGGFTELDFDNGGVLSSGLVTALGLFAADVIAGFTSDGQDFEAGNYNDTLTRFAPWLTAIVNTYAAVQRRRASGVGS